MAQNVTETGKREQAIGMVAADVLTDEEIARQLGIARRTLARWKMAVDFQARVQAVVDAVRQAVVDEGISNRQNRVDALNDRWRRMQSVVDARADDLRDIPGGATGLLVHQVKGVGAGKSFHLVDEYAVDTGLLRELREHEKQAAQELGQWTDEASGMGVVIIRNYIGVKIEEARNE